MTANPTMVNVNYDLLDAVRLMRNRGVRRLPIVNEHRHLLGIVTMDDVVTALGAEVGDLAGTVQKEFGLEAGAQAASR
jgi:CBS domain-containing protein